MLTHGRLAVSGRPVPRAWTDTRVAVAIGLPRLRWGVGAAAVTWELIDAAEVAEVEYTAFTSEPKNEQVTARLIVRRIPECNRSKQQGERVPLPRGVHQQHRRRRQPAAGHRQLGSHCADLGPQHR